MASNRTTASPPADGAAAPTRPRLYYLDNLRVALTVLVVLHHAAIAYGNIAMWYYVEPADDPSGLLLDVFNALNQTFFMGFFFMIAGFFTPGSHDRKGARGFIGGRLVRLGVPLLLFVVLFRPLLGLGDYLADPGGTPFWRYAVANMDPGPMWFVATLLVFALAYVLIRRFAPEREAAAAPAAQVVPAGPAGAIGPLAVTGSVALLIAVTYLWRIMVPSGTSIAGVLPTPAYMPQYVLLFAAGVLAFRKGWFDAVPRWAGWGGAAAALFMVPVYVLVITVLGDPAALQPGSWQTLAVAATESTLAAGTVLALSALFQRRFNRRSAVGRFLSDHAYAVYFLHPAVLVGLNHAFSEWEAPAVAKFAAVGALALPLCWGAAYLLRSLPRADRVF
ncbi:acyltransferase family protein [Streptomonospora litoralis]|uniref:Glucans biosynthesis protein n=1 Tax=Streptomonospora litoralis TaxID=2498135 RepID=A0A4P6PY57_9ACTN|nr:acyltransferase [Streptomonospora litoralis]QBI53216.1 glucans biosynthesis protein [Streptomonospora litoralis]